MNEQLKCTEMLWTVGEQFHIFPGVFPRALQFLGMNVCNPRSSDFVFAKHLWLGSLEVITKHS